MKHLCSLPFILAYLFSFAQNDQGRKLQYYCAPCGCSYDKKLFDNAGKCPDCGMRLLEKGTVNYEIGSVSPDGIISYTLNQFDSTAQMYYKRPNAPGAVKIPGEGGGAKFSTDGKKIVFNANESDILLYDLETSVVKNISKDLKLPGLQSPSWGSSANRIYFSAGTFPNIGVYSYDLVTKKLEGITPMEGLRYGAVVSPDGKRMAYRCAKGRPGESMQKGIAVFDLVTKEEKFITNIGEYPTWSPDGKQLAFHWPDSSRFCIYVVNSDGTGLRQITERREGDSELPYWSSDGKKIYFQTNRRKGNWEIWVMNADGTVQTPFIFKSH